MGLLLLTALASVGTAPAPPEEVASALADLAGEDGTFYVRIDGRIPKSPGVAPAGAHEAMLRVEALTRGRPWPGRWTLLEIELHSSVAETLSLSFADAPGSAPIPLTGGGRQTLRIPLTSKPADVKLRSTSPSGFAGKVEFRRLRLLDDRWTVWDDGWKVERTAGLLTLTPTSGTPIRVSADAWRVTEAGVLRAVLMHASGRGGAVYASGRVSADPFAPDLAPRDATRVTVALPDDQGRLDRQTEGDTDGDGFNDRLGATVIRVAENTRRLTLSVSAPAPARRPAFEFRGLPAGTVTALWEGRLVTTHLRLPDGTLLLELPGDLGPESRLELRVDAAR